jgi:hypothetical protein
LALGSLFTYDNYYPGYYGYSYPYPYPYNYGYSAPYACGQWVWRPDVQNYTWVPCGSAPVAPAAPVAPVPGAYAAPGAYAVPAVQPYQEIQ